MRNATWSQFHPLKSVVAGLGIVLLTSCATLDDGLVSRVTPESSPPIAKVNPAAAPIIRSQASTSASLATSPTITRLPSPPAIDWTPSPPPPVATVAFQGEVATPPAESSSGSTPELLQSTAPAPAPRSNNFQPRTVHEALNPATEEFVGTPQNVRPVSLEEALALAGGENPQIAIASARYREAYARLSQANVLWLPSLRAGMSYHHHDGNLQASDGNIVDVDRSSLQAGLGTGAVGAGPTPVPGVVAQFHAADAIFQPKIASHAAAARAAGTRSATNDTLLSTALGYLELMRTTQELRIAEETEENAKSLVDITAAFSKAGQGPQADADRALVEYYQRRNDVSRAREASRVAAVRLAEILRIDPTVNLEPLEPALVPIDLVDTGLPLEGLVATGLSNRPELSEAQSLVCEAVQRYNREKYAPLVPSVLLGVSQGGFGGGLGSSVNNFDNRFDFDAGVYWELRNFGLGEKARREETTARYDQARMIQVQMMDRVAREVVESSTQVQGRRERIAIAEQGILTAQNSYRSNLARTKEGQGLPIEVLQSLQALDASRREYLRTVADYNEAQFRLQRALGWPIQ